MPGFIDPHIHYPQTQVIASYGAQLLEWLENSSRSRNSPIRNTPRATPNDLEEELFC